MKEGMPGMERGLYSLVEYRPDRSAAPLVFGVVLFPPGRELLVQFAASPPGNLRDGARWAMAARALVARLRRARPEHLNDIQAFIELEGNEMQLGSPRTILIAVSAEETLRQLVNQHLRSPDPLSFPLITPRTSNTFGVEEFIRGRDGDDDLEHPVAVRLRREWRCRFHGHVEAHASNASTSWWLAERLVGGLRFTCVESTGGSSSQQQPLHAPRWSRSTIAIDESVRAGGAPS